ncbi:hypothetical protein GBF38_012779 [Nibea albiflora]|uniref:Uncharacterized protein n=1 Tax=Nibea albiflora TaxID=240163 RepID=A0ACB7EJV2_NIBAL|nr:hypothetical protein GBF38_012779 [Nibea albiflora]
MWVTLGLCVLLVQESSLHVGEEGDGLTAPDQAMLRRRLKNFDALQNLDKLVEHLPEPCRTGVPNTSIAIDRSIARRDPVDRRAVHTTHAHAHRRSRCCQYGGPSITRPPPHRRQMP